MARSIGYEDEECFRLVESFTRADGSCGHITWGPYSTLAQARGMRTRQRRYPTYAGSVFTIDRAPIAWEAVE
ncbi:hypothetical protein [Streptomyces longwoodensis]|uniref:hypothetical protein n=1 Tax=Streptomyces longwoodensis TaxID=68231 RepID=UPI003401947E